MYLTIQHNHETKYSSKQKNIDIAVKNAYNVCVGYAFWYMAANDVSDLENQVFNSLPSEIKRKLQIFEQCHITRMTHKGMKIDIFLSHNPIKKASR
jgi:hypothetical protein